MNKCEILAPAGGKEQLIAAVRCGADAVYLGTEQFNARSSATNFDRAALNEAVGYCHARNVKVYVTMNTLVTDNEINDVINEIKTIAESGADAVIIQDLAVARLWKEYCPEMKLHASTQMTIHNVEGAKQAEKLGFERIVLARELTAAEIKQIKDNIDAEIEIFVHGALCMSISGTCLLSSMIGARSGNRGKCAQPCRLNFKCADREYALSLKDLSLLENADLLNEIGVDSLKIEGRMKRPEYVAAAVSAAKNAVNKMPYDTQKLQAVFSRSGFTNGYFTGKRTLDMFGYRRKEDVVAAAPILKDLAVLYKDEIQKIPVSFHLKTDLNITELTATDGTNTVCITGDGASAAINKPLDAEYAAKSLSKTGGTCFYTDKLTFDIADGVALSASQMNAMRRDALDRLYATRSEITPKKFIIPEKKSIPAALHAFQPKLRLRFEVFAQAFNDERAEKIILPVSQIIKHPEAVEIFGKKLVAQLPALIFGENENTVASNLDKLKDLCVNDVMADNIGALSSAAKKGFTVHGGHGLNVLNSIAFEEYVSLGADDITISPELNISAIERMTASKQKGVIGYGFLPLMRFRACPAQGKNGCADCKGVTKITDRMNTDFYIVCSNKKYSSLLNSVPLYIGDKNIKNIDFATLYFTVEKPELCKKIVAAYASKSSISGKKTGGLYYRELL
ncbi:MAG: U32 family peptidase [Clostridia bacterium]|nr:U32 family peptidase [Clostridia bacterium]